MFTPQHIMNSVPDEIVYRICEHIPDIRALASASHHFGQVLANLPDWACWRDGRRAGDVLQKMVETVHHKPLAYACDGNFEMIKLFMSNISDKDKSRYFIAAAKGGHLEIIKYIVQNGIELFDPYNNGYTIGGYSTVCAAKHGYFEIIRYLVQRGVQLDEDTSYLEFAVSHNDLESVKWLFSIGFVIDIYQDLQILSYTNDNLDIFRYLVEQGWSDDLNRKHNVLIEAI